MAFEGSSPSDVIIVENKINGNSLMVERYIVTIKMWVRIPFTTKYLYYKNKKIKMYGPIA